MSTDPWTNRYLQERLRTIIREWQGAEVTVRRFAQAPVRGTVLRGDEGAGLLILGGYGAVSVAEIEDVQAA